MHVEVMQFLRQSLALVLPRLAVGRPVLAVCELGSKIVNGTPRALFVPGISYHGVDISPGRGVDQVADAADHTVDIGEGYDLVLCCEVLEHTPMGSDICHNAHRILRSGGIYLVTCATCDRVAHSTSGGSWHGQEHYANISEGELRQWLEPFSLVLTHCRANVDLYALAVK